MTIRIDIRTFTRNNRILFIGINNEIIVILPVRLPKRIFFKSVCLLNMTPVAKSNNKSKRKFKIGMPYTDGYLYIAIAIILIQWVVKNVVKAVWGIGLA